MIKSEDIVGAWRLVSWSIEIPDAEAPVEPFGSAPAGWLVYSADGVMSAQLMSSGRASLGGRSIRKLSESERLDVLETFFAYAGRYHTEDDVIVHQVDVSLNPDFVGQDQRRTAVLQGDTLTLTGQETDIKGRQRAHCLIWQRV